MDRASCFDQTNKIPHFERYSSPCLPPDKRIPECRTECAARATLKTRCPSAPGSGLVTAVVSGSVQTKFGLGFRQGSGLAPAHALSWPRSPLEARTSAWCHTTPSDRSSLRMQGDGGSPNRTTEPETCADPRPRKTLKLKSSPFSRKRDDVCCGEFKPFMASTAILTLAR